MKRECLNHFFYSSLGHLEHILAQFARFYNTYRPHQSLGNRTLPEAAADQPETVHLKRVGRVRCRRFLGGLLRHYYRAAA